MSLPGNIGLLSRMPTPSSSQYGNVDGPASSTDSALALFNGTTGKLIKNSSVTLSGTAFTGVGASDLTLTAGGTNQNITLTPSGSGNITLTTDTGYTNISASDSDIARFTSNQTDARVEMYETSTRRFVIGYNTSNVVLQADGALGLAFSTGTSGNRSITLTPNGTGGVGIGGAQLGTDMLTVVGRANMSAGLEWSWRHTTGLSMADLSGVRVDDNTGYLAFRTRASGTLTEGFRLSGGANVQITGGAGNMTITSGTGASRTLVFQTTTSGSTPTTALTLNDTQDATFAARIIQTNAITPASAAAAGVVGTMAWDTGFIYICTATNTWKRVAIATW